MRKKIECKQRAPNSHESHAKGPNNTNEILISKWFVAGFVAVVTFVVFLPSLQNEFVNWDDQSYVYENPFIRSLDAQLFRSAFGGFHAANWHPLTWISHALDYALWGLNPLGHHLTNNIIHALNAAVVAFLVMMLMGVYKKTEEERREPSQPFVNDRTMRITGATAGLLFGLHPLHVESVAWVAERKDLLCAFFFLLTIITYTHYVSEVSQRIPIKPSSRFFNKKYLLTIGLFILSLSSKPMAVSLPFVLLILDWYVFERIRSLRTFWTAFVEKLPFLVLTLISSILTILAQQAGGAVSSVEVLPLVSRVIVAAKSLIMYLVKMIVPLNLVPFYPYPKSISLFSLKDIIPIVIVVAITVTCIAVMRRQKLWISVWGCYVITLMPVLGIVQVGSQSMADRFTYLPSLGPFILIGLMMAMVYEKVSVLVHWRVMAKMASFLVWAAILISISCISREQIGVWKNSILFWNYVIEEEPGKVPLAHVALGDAYSSKGLLDMAIQQYQAALALKPEHMGAHLNLGAAYASKGQLDMAVRQFETALKLKSDDARGHFDLGNAYLSLGQLDKAIEQYRTALDLQPDYVEAHFNLGNAYLSLGQWDMAIEQYGTALHLKPDYVEVHSNLGAAYASKGQSDMAIQQFETVLKLTPDDSNAHFNLGLIYLNNGSQRMAQTEFELVLRNKPDDYRARQILDSIIAGKR